MFDSIMVELREIHLLIRELIQQDAVRRLLYVVVSASSLFVVAGLMVATWHASAIWHDWHQRERYRVVVEAGVDPVSALLDQDAAHIVRMLPLMPRPQLEYLLACEQAGYTRVTVERALIAEIAKRVRTDHPR
ncbi:MAG: hypothetical protein H6981_07240 [Gammaproteobacteria bacterium]|nr:hypothetical protein [Gammaproteobacteria bacterium]